MSLDPSHTSAYLWPSVRRFLVQLADARTAPSIEGHRTGSTGVFEIGCGNGSTAAMLTDLGCWVTGIDIDAAVVAAANSRPIIAARFHQRSIYDAGLPEYFGRWPAVVALEVIEHCPDAWGFMAAVRDLLDGDGRALISTPYHGWLKNVCIAASGRHDAHFDPLWRGGHLKFFSVATMTRLCEESGLRVVRVERVGRIAPLAKSMIFTLAKR